MVAGALAGGRDGERGAAVQAMNVFSAAGGATTPCTHEGLRDDALQGGELEGRGVTSRRRSPPSGRNVGWQGRRRLGASAAQSTLVARTEG